jgi:uncharacterized protein YjbI with pentapeptide repeats
MKTLIFVLALVGVALCENVRRICPETDKVELLEGRMEYEEVVEGTKVNLKCPTNDPTLCLWHHEDRRIPEHYGKWAMSRTGSLQLNGAEVEHSGTYHVIVSGRKYIYHLVVRPITIVEDFYNDLDNYGQEVRDKKIEKKYLYNTNIKNMRFINVELKNLHLHKVEFEYVTFVNVTFRWTNKLPTRVHFYRCNFINVRWENVSLVSSQFKNCKWTDDGKVRTRVTFKNPCIRDTIFCENWWTNTRWEDGEVYNTTFIKNRFNAHTWRRTRFISYYVGKVDCKLITSKMIIINWRIREERCEAYVFMPDNNLMKKCDLWDKNERKLCHFYPSIRFLDCTLIRSRIENVNLRAVEWRRTRLDRCEFRETTIEENYFIYCTWSNNRMEKVVMRAFNKFMANYFTSDTFRFTLFEKLWFHSCRIYDVEMRWEQPSTRLHFENCIGNDVRFRGEVDTYRLITSTVENLRFEYVTITKFEHCNAFVLWWTVDTNTEIQTVKLICDEDYVTEDCRDTWYKTSSIEVDRCPRDIMTWCRKDYNIRHPVCFAFTRPKDPVCCPEKTHWKCTLDPTTWRWWRNTDFKCDDQKGYVNGDIRTLEYRDTRFVVPDCIKRHLWKMNIRGRRDNLWVREFKRTERTTRQKDVFTKFEDPCDYERNEKLKRCCSDETGKKKERQRCCDELRMQMERCDRNVEERDLFDRRRYDLDRTIKCIKY